VQFAKGDLVSTVMNALASSGLPASRLELEITETVLLEGSDHNVRILDQLHELGVRIALDDFGTGYSSLSYMQRFPIDTLKIDRSFMHDVDSGSGNASIVQAVISLGKSLHMRVVAEGVETGEQLQFLQEHACPEGQGYFLARPTIARNITRLLEVDSTAGLRDVSRARLAPLTNSRYAQ
jgi:diguanylate cyclase